MQRAGEAAGTALVDFTDRLTVFVRTVGAPTFAACRARLAAPSNVRWVAPYRAEIPARCQADPTEENLFAPMGAATDCRPSDGLPGFAALREFCAVCPVPPSPP